MIEHQTNGATSFDRYPELFAYLQRANEVKRPRIMSFGCSTGEECWTLRKYFPTAQIVGVDSNQERATVADTVNLDPDIDFYLAPPSGQFDIVTALSVFCNWPETYRQPESSHLYPFDNFHKEMLLLDGKVKVGGLLALYNASYRFKDSLVSDRYNPITTSRIPLGFVDLFGPDCKRLVDQTNSQVIWRKKW